LNFGPSPLCQCHCWSRDGSLYAVCIGKAVHVTSPERSFDTRTVFHLRSEPRDISVCILKGTSVVALAAATARGIEVCFDDDRPPLCLAPLAAAACVAVIQNDAVILVAGVGADGRACVWKTGAESVDGAQVPVVVFKAALPLSSQRPTHMQLNLIDGIALMTVVSWDGAIYTATVAESSDCSASFSCIRCPADPTDRSSGSASTSKSGYGASFLCQDPSDGGLIVADSHSRTIFRVGTDAETTPSGNAFDGTLMGLTSVILPSSCDCGVSNRFAIVATASPNQLRAIQLSARYDVPVQTALSIGSWAVKVSDGGSGGIEGGETRVILQRGSAPPIAVTGLSLAANQSASLCPCSTNGSAFWALSWSVGGRSTKPLGLFPALFSWLSPAEVRFALVCVDEGAIREDCWNGRFVRRSSSIVA
jgi:hypothetical protein